MTPAGWVAPGSPPPGGTRGVHPPDLPYRPGPPRRGRRLPVLIAGCLALSAACAVLALMLLGAAPGGGLFGAGLLLAGTGLICWVMGLARAVDTRPPMAWIGTLLMVLPQVSWLAG